MAKAYAQSKSKTADGKDAVTPKQQRIWIRITAYTRQVMDGISKSFDEFQRKRINESPRLNPSHPYANFLCFTL